MVMTAFCFHANKWVWKEMAYEEVSVGALLLLEESLLLCGFALFSSFVYRLEVLNLLASAVFTSALSNSVSF